MWSRISDLAVKIDANFGDSNDDVDADSPDEEYPAPSSGAVEVEEFEEMDGGPTPTRRATSPPEVDDDDEDGGGWGDDDDDGFVDDYDDDDEDLELDGEEGLRRNGEYDPTTANDGKASSSSSSFADNGGPSTEEKTDIPSSTNPPRPPPPEVVTVSAPGKALIAGGYLVLEPSNPGVVLAAEGCRFHTTITFRPPHDVTDDVHVVDESGSLHSVPLDVYSPQFDRVFSYHLSYYSPTSYEADDGDDDDDDDDVVLRLHSRTSRHVPNKFVERSLLLALGYVRRTMGAIAFHSRIKRRRRFAISDLVPSSPGGSSSSMAIALKLRADNDFYSQIANLRERGLDLTPSSLEMLEPFLPCPKDEVTGELIVNKTGMGSSAALVASLVGALLNFFGVISLPANYDGEDGGGGDVIDGSGGNVERREGLRIAHNLSQICHCYAQGKVGSGFDISSAVYGTHIYTRFSEALVDEFLARMESPSSDGKGGVMQLSGGLSRRLVALVNSGEWDCTFTPFSLPPGLELLMADVCGGSESPSMARGILEWKKRRKVGFMDDYYWKDLKRCNKRIVTLLTDQFASQTIHDGLHRDGAEIISTRTAEQWKKPMPSSWHLFEGSSWDVALKLFDLRMAFLECRQNLKGMGNSAGVPVEPDEQTAVANATMALPGVVAAGVPGAGGYDALFVIYVKGPATCGGKSDRVRDEIGKLWRDMSDGSHDRVLCPLSVRAAGSGGGLCATKLGW